MYKDNNLAGKKKTVVVDVAVAAVLNLRKQSTSHNSYSAVASTLPSGANHLRKALEDPLYKAKLTNLRKQSTSHNS